MIFEYFLRGIPICGLLLFIICFLMRNRYKPIYMIKAIKPVWYITRLPLYVCMIPYLLIRKKSIKAYFRNEWIINRVRQKAGLTVTRMEKDSLEGTILIRYRVRHDVINIKFDMKKKTKRNEKELFIEACEDGTGLRATNFIRARGFIKFSLYDYFKPIMDIKYDKFKLSVGTSIDGFYYWNFNTFPHALIVGPTGTGKTNFLENLIYAIKANEMDIYCIDGKVVDLIFMSESFKSYVPFYRNEYESIMEEIKSFEDRMANRFESMVIDGIKNYYENDEYIAQFLIIEELIGILDTAEKKWKEEFLSRLSHVIKLGRGAGFFVILVMQRPDVAYISGMARSNINFKIVLGAADNETYTMTLNDNTLEPLEKGQGWVKQGSKINILSIPKYEDVKEIMEEKKNVTK